MAQYDAYILRIWRSIGTAGPQWSGRVEHLRKGEPIQFTDLEELLDYLRRQAGPAPPLASGAPDTNQQGSEM